METDTGAPHLRKRGPGQLGSGQGWTGHL